MNRNRASLAIVGIYLMLFGAIGTYFAGQFAFIPAILFLIPGIVLIILALLMRNTGGSIGGTSYDDYLRQQESKKKDHTYCAGTVLEDNCRYNKSYDARTETKKLAPACVFLIIFGTIFVLFGVLFISIVSTFVLDESILFMFIIVPMIFIIIGAAIIAYATLMALRGQTPSNLTINGMTAEEYDRMHGYYREEEKEEDGDTESSLSTDWKP